MVGLAAIACLLVMNLIGCSSVVSHSMIDDRWIPQMRPPAPVRAGQPATVEKQSKPEEASEDYRQRHPSMWKRKLRAMYASL